MTTNYYSFTRLIRRLQIFDVRQLSVMPAIVNQIMDLKTTQQHAILSPLLFDLDFQGQQAVEIIYQNNNRIKCRLYSYGLFINDQQ